MNRRPQENRAPPPPAHARMTGRTGRPAGQADHTTGTRPKERRTHRKSGRHPPGTHRTADTSPPGIYTPAQPSRYMARAHHDRCRPLRRCRARRPTAADRLQHSGRTELAHMAAGNPIHRPLGHPPRIDLRWDAWRHRCRDAHRSWRPRRRAGRSELKRPMGATTAIALRSVRLHLWYVLHRYA